MTPSDPNPMQMQDRRSPSQSWSPDPADRKVTDWWSRTRLWRCRKTKPPHSCAEACRMATCSSAVELHVTTQKAKIARINMSDARIARRSQTRSCVWRQPFPVASGMERHISCPNSGRKWSQAPRLLRCSTMQLVPPFRNKDLLASRHSLRLWGPALHWEFRFHHSSGLCRIWPLHNLRQFRLQPAWLRATRRMRWHKSHQSSQEGAACVAVAEHPQRKRRLSAPTPSHPRSWKGQLEGRRPRARHLRRRCEALQQMPPLHLPQMCRYLLAASRYSKTIQNRCLP
mmetsp:Transcript_118033/g.280198  ORF Transcript_118033/g.280198 Transcript_118033/m.280198 type:complete len:285 (+) Transcript_118033:171-1025(+)